MLPIAKSMPAVTRQLAVLDAGLRRLHNNGINGCVIDWTDLVEFYGKFGFTPYRKYVQLVKAL